MLHINLPDQGISSHDFETKLHSNFTPVLSLRQIQKMKEQAMNLLRQPSRFPTKVQDRGANYSIKDVIAKSGVYKQPLMT
jgi:hypothetical protein